jgi:hypothetical protein
MYWVDNGTLSRQTQFLKQRRYVAALCLEQQFEWLLRKGIDAGFHLGAVSRLLIKADDHNAKRMLPLKRAN